MLVELLGGRTGDNLIGLVVVGCIFAGPLIVGAWTIWLKHRRKELQLELKRDMVAAGMSADEIVRVLEAGESPEPAGES